jgi:hypothetical protein
MPYVNGANLGGWLVMENWLFPNVLLLRLGHEGIADNQEIDYIARMRQRGIDAVRSMHAHWDSFLCDAGDAGLLRATAPPAKLAALAAAGVTAVRIPVGYWALEEPVEPAAWPVNPVGGPLGRAPYEQAGLSRDGFVTGGAVYLRAAGVQPSSPRHARDRRVPTDLVHERTHDGRRRRLTRCALPRVRFGSPLAQGARDACDDRHALTAGRRGTRL